MRIAQDQHYKGEDWWEWSVWIDASPDELATIEKVIWRLHPTFPQPVRETTDRQNHFKLDTAGWGTFPIRADVVTTGGKPIKLKHELELHYPDGTPSPA
jgi:transcription initiation factor IIF auxiliary subunit